MAKRALLVGIDHYDNLSPLAGCVADATALRALLETHEDGSPNYNCRLLISSQTRVTRKSLRTCWNELFDDFEGDALLFFAGHGSLTRVGGVLATQEWEREDPGLPMDELLTLANKSRARSVLLILDCCHSGALGNLAGLQSGSVDQALLRDGVTILAASRPSEPSAEEDGHGLFTNLLLGALSGGAADVRGRVSAASLYAYAEQALGPWDQRPMYKSHANRLPPVRLCEPTVPDSILREMTKIFKKADAPFRLGPSYERTHPLAQTKHVEVFEHLKILRNAGILTTEQKKDLYFVALEKKWVKLSPLGQFYWHLANNKRI
jgi:hypothetical protein